MTSVTNNGPAETQHRAPHPVAQVVEHSEFFPGTIRDMGLLTIFKKDWSAELDRVSGYLRDDEPVLALELLRKIERRVDGDLLSRARELIETSEIELFDSLLRRAQNSESQGELADAADWLLAAIDRCKTDAERKTIEGRREELLRQIEDGINPFGNGPQVAPQAEWTESDTEFQFDALVQTLVPSMAELYLDRPIDFQSALVALNQGDATVAIEQLERLLTESPEDSILRLERGRAHLLLGNNDLARQDFEAVWDSLGTDDIDTAGSHSVPSLWAECTLETDPEVVALRLEPLAAPHQASTHLCELYAAALVRLGDTERAIPYLQSTLRNYPSEQRFSFLLARVLVEDGEVLEAIACLEAAVGPGCSSGCAVGPRHLPSVRALATLYLNTESNLERVAELMAVVAQSQRGNLKNEDHLILARYYDLTGNEEAASSARVEAERLLTLGPTAESGPTGLGGANQRIL